MPRSSAYVVIILVLFGWICITVTRMIIAPLLPVIESDFQVSHAEAGLLMSSYMLPYALMQIPGGVLSDRLKKKWIMGCAVFGSSVATLVIFLARSFEQVILLRFLGGLFSGLYFSSSTMMVTLSTDAKTRGKALGVVLTGGSISNLILFTTTNLFPVESINWRSLFLLFAVPGFFCTGLVGALIQEPESRRKGAETAKPRTLSLFAVIRKRSILAALSFNLLCPLAAWSFATFMPTYLVLERGLSISEASLLMIINSSAAVFSSYASGYLTDKHGFRQPLLISMVAICLISFLIPVAPLGASLYGIFVVWGLLGSMPYIALSTYMTTCASTEALGKLLGTYNMMSFISAAISPIIFGYVADVLGFRPFFTLALTLNIVSLIIAVIIKKERL